MFSHFFKKSNQKGIGGKGEDRAATFLRKKGYNILQRNWYNIIGKRLGEIDIIAQAKDGTIVFVEVKTRHSTQQSAQMLPEEQITPHKLHKLQRIAEAYIKEHALWQTPWRIDAVSVVFVQGEKKPIIKHLESIFI